MKSGFKLMKQVFSGEMCIKEREGAREKRLEESCEIIAYRRQA